MASDFLIFILYLTAMKMTPLYVISIFCFYQNLQAAPAAQEIPQYFGKTLNTEDLRGSFPLSGRELGKFVQNRGVDLISLAPGESPESSKDDLADWKLALHNQDALGFYNSPDSARRHVDRPTIVVFELNDKWTVIHEYMHYLYDQQRAKDHALSEAKLFEAQKNAREDYLDITSAMNQMTTLDLDRVHRAIVAFTDYLKYELQLMRQSLAEEIAIETTLSRLYEQGRIPDLHPMQYRTAQNYIATNKERLAAQLKTFYDAHKNFAEQAPHLEISAMNGIQQELDQMTEELDATLPR